jgi:MFS family permease
VYAIPNLFTAFIGGILVDKFGAGVILNISLTLVSVGTGVVAIAPYLTGSSYAVMLLGRFIFGYDK